LLCKTKRRPDIPWIVLYGYGYWRPWSDNPYMGFGNGALIPLYGELSLRVIAALSPVLFGLLVAAFEIAVGLMVLNRQKYVKMGLLGMTVFEIALTPSDTIQFIWLGLAVGQVYLLTKESDITFLEMLRSWKPA
jgi:hypothetical protein